MALNEAECEQKGLIKRDAGYLFGKNTTYASVKIDRFCANTSAIFIELLTQRNPQRDTQRTRNKLWLHTNPPLPRNPTISDWRICAARWTKITAD